MDLKQMQDSLDLMNYDNWFQSTPGRAWQVSHEIMMRRLFAGVRHNGNHLSGVDSPRGDPSFDAFLQKIGE